MAKKKMTDKKLDALAKKVGLTKQELSSYIDKAVAKELKKYKLKAEALKKPKRKSPVKVFPSSKGW